MDPMNIILLLLLLYFGFEVWYNYFAKVNKMTDDQLINRYFLLNRKGK